MVVARKGAEGVAVAGKALEALGALAGCRAAAPEATAGEEAMA